MTEGEEKNNRKNGTSPAEWALGIISALVLIGVIGSLIFEAVNRSGEPPMVEIQVDSIRTVGDEYLVQFNIYNRGESTAAGLVVAGSLESDTGSVETSEITIDYLPGNGRREAGIYFTHDPRLFELKMRPVGYDLP